MASLGIGIGLLALPGQSNCSGVLCLSTGQAIGVISIIFVFHWTGKIGLINRSTSRTRFKRAAEFYNSNSDLIYIPEDVDIQISFGLSQNALSLTVNF